MSTDLAENDILRLLQIAGVPASNKGAAAWLQRAMEGAQSSYRAAEHRPAPAEHNSLLDDIGSSATKLSKRIERLRQFPATWRAFWRSSPFGPVYNNRVELLEIIAMLETIATAADAAKDRRTGRPPATGKQHVVDLALAFFVRFSPQNSSGTASGAFSNFAHAFYTAVTGDNGEKQGGLDRQIRRAAKRSSIERARLQRKSPEIA
jgi:hypothetical protein